MFQVALQQAPDPGDVGQIAGFAVAQTEATELTQNLELALGTDRLDTGPERLGIQVGADPPRGETALAKILDPEVHLLA